MHRITSCRFWMLATRRSPARRPRTRTFATRSTRSSTAVTSLVPSATTATRTLQQPTDTTYTVCDWLVATAVPDLLSMKGHIVDVQRSKGKTKIKQLLGWKFLVGYRVVFGGLQLGQMFPKMGACGESTQQVNNVSAVWRAVSTPVCAHTSWLHGFLFSLQFNGHFSR